jgi:hypothetical protein
MAVDGATKPSMVYAATDVAPKADARTKNSRRESLLSNTSSLYIEIAGCNGKPLIVSLLI